MSLCVDVGSGVLTLAITTFTLSWTHSVEHVRWEERWQIGGDTLQLVEARVKGSGAGMEPGESARLDDGWWVWEPTLSAVPELVLASSGATGSGWQLCHRGGCVTLGREAGEPVRLTVCVTGH